MFVARCSVMISVALIYWSVVMSVGGSRQKMQNPSFTVSSRFNIFFREVPRRLIENGSAQTLFSICCSLQKARVHLSCERDVTNFSLPRIRESVENDSDVLNEPGQNSHSVVKDPCTFHWMKSSLPERYYLLRNGSLYTPNFTEGSLADMNHYCFFRDPGSSEYRAKMCYSWVVRTPLDLLFVMLAVSAMMIIFVGYTIVPELRNLNGRIFRSYIATYIGVYFAALMVLVTTDNESKAYTTLCSLFLSLAQYLAWCCTIWLNVMSYNIWKMFRTLRSIGQHTQEREQHRFIWYATYVLGFPAVYNGSGELILNYVPTFMNDTTRYHFTTWSYSIAVTAFFACNAYFYASTALRIKHQRKATAYLIDGTNRHTDNAEQWFNLYLKLCVIMGGHIIIWAVWLVWRTHLFTHILALLELMQSTLIFFVCLWKDNIKGSVYQQLRPALLQVQHFFARVKTTEIAHL